ncbi:hypothetical protein F5Y06DRAFT_142533 [Hypoxylon sp. FL0890]|nr:hypothetical protein F5Y06DRAFT_142533 [Hypoxylon sp. FL0890]
MLSTTLFFLFTLFTTYLLQGANNAIVSLDYSLGLRREDELEQVASVHQIPRSQETYLDKRNTMPATRLGLMVLDAANSRLLVRVYGVAIVLVSSLYLFP